MDCQVWTDAQTALRMTSKSPSYGMAMVGPGCFSGQYSSSCPSCSGSMPSSEAHCAIACCGGPAMGSLRWVDKGRSQTYNDCVVEPLSRKRMPAPLHLMATNRRFQPFKSRLRNGAGWAWKWHLRAVPATIDLMVGLPGPRSARLVVNAVTSYRFGCCRTPTCAWYAPELKQRSARYW
jgi:hypothetical protein